MTVISSRAIDYVEPRNNGTLVHRIALIVIVAAVMLSPEFTIREGLYQPRVEDFILLAVAAVWFLHLPSKRLSQEPLIGRSPGNLTLTRIMAGMFYFAIISIGVGTIAFQQSLIINDWVILPMFVRYWIAFQVGQWGREDVFQRVFLWALLIILGISAGIGVLQHFNLLGVNDWLTPVYVAEHAKIVGLRLVKQGSPYGRVVGTHGDPRHYAYMIVVGGGLCSVILLNLRHRGMRVAALVVLGLSLMAIAFAASRTAVLSLVVVVSAAFALHLREPKGWAKLIGTLIVVVIVALFLFQVFASSTFENRVTDLDSLSFERSFNARIRDFRKPFRLALESPVIWLTGRGPSKAALRTDSHNDFGWCFHRFGLPGLLLYLLLIYHSLKLSLSAWRDEVDPIKKIISAVAFLTVINWLIFAMAENILKDPQLMALNMVLVGAGIGVSQSRGASS